MNKTVTIIPYSPSLMIALIGASIETTIKSHNKFRNSTQWPIFVRASRLAYLLHTEISTLPSYERHFKYRRQGRTVLVQLGCGIVNGIIILWYMAIFIWLNVPMCHTAHNNQHTMQVSLSAAWNKVCIAFTSWKALKLFQPPKYLASTFMCGRLDFRSLAQTSVLFFT